jgi:hypothetical protein
MLGKWPRKGYTDSEFNFVTWNVLQVYLGVRSQLQLIIQNP